MFQVKNQTKFEIEVERSTFISYLIPVQNEEDVKTALLNLHKEHPKARHICYAYNIEGNYKSSDDGEPKGTAGRPIQEVLVKKQLNNCLLVVVRYFGGILLGAGRLLRTYVESATQVVEHSNLLEEIECMIYEVKIKPSYYDSLRSFCNKYDCMLEKVIFDEYISLEIWSKSDIIDNAISFFNGDIEIKFLNKKKVLK